MYSKAPGDYKPSVNFGEYGAPGFENIVETVGKAKTFGVMSLETCIDEMYGDTWTEEEKTAEIERLRIEQGLSVEPTSLIDDLNGDGNGEEK